MNEIIRRIVTVAVFAGATGPVLAQQGPAELELCGMRAADMTSLLAPQLVGAWTGRQGGGLLTGAGRAITLPPQTDQMSGSIFLVDGALAIQMNTAVFSMEFYDGNLNFDPPGNVEAAWQPGTLAVLDNETLSMAAGCDVNDLPKLHISGSFAGVDGMVQFDGYLVVLSSSFLYGVATGNSSSGTMARRAFAIRR